MEQQIPNVAELSENKMREILAESAHSTVDTRITERKDIIDRVERSTVWGVRRWDNDEEFKKQKIYDEDEAKECFDGMPQFSTIYGNVLCDVGIQNLLKLGMTSGGTQWANGNANLGVGTSATGEVHGDTALTAGAVYQAMDSTWPQIGGTYSTVITFQSTYASGSANISWQEFGCFTAASATNMLNHKTSNQGTKTAGQSWQLQLAITFS